MKHPITERLNVLSACAQFLVSTTTAGAIIGTKTSGPGGAKAGATVGLIVGVVVVAHVLQKNDEDGYLHACLPEVT